SSPARTISVSTSIESVDGPKVATILVRECIWRSGMGAHSAMCFRGWRIIETGNSTSEGRAMKQKMWAILALGVILGASLQWARAAATEPPARVFEIRTYHTFPGRLDALHKRFREHTMKIFEKHG